MVRPAVVCSRLGLELAAGIAAAVDGEVIEAGGERLLPELHAAFDQGRPIVALTATAIVIRALASRLGDKHIDPPVICVTRDGGHVIPLLGLHHGGQRLADRIAATLGATSVNSSGTSRLSRTALDDPGPGYVLANHQDYQEFALRLMAGEAVQVEGHAPWADDLPQDGSAILRMTITEKNDTGSAAHLVFHPLTLAVGVGCERGTDPDEVALLVADTLSQAGLAAAAVACHASIDLKEDEPAIHGLANVRFFTAAELNAQEPRLEKPSEAVRAEIGVASVAEASALAAAGPGAELLVAKTKSRRATCAVARAAAPITEFRGRERGRLFVVGLGPGDRDMRSPSASLALSHCSDWVGYGLYLDLAADLRHAGLIQHRFPLGGEEDRVRHAINLARQGKRVALVCSGDAGIYAMASLVFEIIDLEPCRIGVEVLPGISAFQAAAARAGAMIGHDFCCISLSDLLTPWEMIEKRVKAAAEGDFVVSFYNPRSLKRRDQLERAFAILAQHRPPQTPVVIAANLGRPEEKVKIVALKDFNAEDVDMLTLVMVGASQSRSFIRGDGHTYAYTPRGYAKKREAAE